MEFKARYDNYRLIRVTLKTEDHVKLFQELEAESDSYTFYGHARKVGQDLTIMVAAHKYESSIKSIKYFLNNFYVI